MTCAGGAASYLIEQACRQFSHPCQQPSAVKLPLTTGLVTLMLFPLLTRLGIVKQALRQHCSASGHDHSRVPKPAKHKSSPGPPKGAVPLTLSVEPSHDHIEMDRLAALLAFSASLRVMACGTSGMALFNGYRSAGHDLAMLLHG